MATDVTPGLAVRSARIFGNAKDVVFARLNCQVMPDMMINWRELPAVRQHGQQLHVAAKAAGVDCHRIVDQAQQQQHRQANELDESARRPVTDLASELL